MLGHLLRLRYRLLWAQTRSRNGKIAIFIAAYLFVAFAIALLALGGLGAAYAAVRSGRAELVTRLILGGFFFNSLAASVIMGFGMNAVFSDTALRRFPLSAFERLAARQLIAFVEPLWMIVLALYLGLGAGLYVLAGTSYWLNTLAAILLVACNYLLARVLIGIVERIMQTRAGPVLLISCVIAFSITPGLLAPRIARNSSWFTGFFEVLRFTPPFSAASVMAAPTAPAGLYLLLLLLWAAGLLGFVFLLERRPMGTRTIAKAAASWDTFYDRIATRFGPLYGPIAGKVLRYYLRSNRVRYNLVLAVPMLAVLSFMQSQGGGPMARFGVALGCFALTGFIGTAAMVVNQFGYDGGGFRRYFLLPVSSDVVVRASSLAGLALGSALLPPAFLLWFLFSGVPTTPVMFVMLLGSGLGGLLFLNACALWTTLLSPRKTSFASTFGNNLSFGGNVLVIGSVILMTTVPKVLAKTRRIPVLLEYWWAFPLFFILSAIFYFVTLRAGGGVFLARRERLIALMEGRD